MWNRIDPLIQSIARKVERTDPRMEIRRDESAHYGSRKKDRSGEDASPIEWEDTTIVSTLALANFLSALLGGRSPLPQTPDKDPDETPILEQHEPASTYISRATGAYQATGRAVHDRNIEEEQPPLSSDAELVTLGADFGEEERNRMRAYIDDLHDLERQDIREVVLLRTLGFLDSIGHGIEHARSGL